MGVQEQAHLGGTVRRLRKAAGLSQWGLAHGAGLSMSVVCAIEQGRKRDPRLSTLRALAGALGVGLDALAEGLPAPKKKGKRP